MAAAREEKDLLSAPGSSPDVALRETWADRWQTTVTDEDGACTCGISPQVKAGILFLLPSSHISICFLQAWFRRRWHLQGLGCVGFLTRACIKNHLQLLGKSLQCYHEFHCQPWHKSSTQLLKSATNVLHVILKPYFWSVDTNCTILQRGCFGLGPMCHCRVLLTERYDMRHKFKGKRKVCVWWMKHGLSCCHSPRKKRAQSINLAFTVVSIFRQSQHAAIPWSKHTPLRSYPCLTVPYWPITVPVQWKQGFRTFHQGICTKKTQYN